MTTKLLSADDFRAAAKVGQAPGGTVFRFTTVEPQVVAEASRKIRFCFSDATVDHAGDSIDPKGWNLGVFRRNPVALFSHMSWEPPIGRASGVGVQGDRLVGDIEFASAEDYPFADTIYRLVKGRFMNAVSVGFLPDDWAFSSDKKRPNGINFKKQTLLEISVCPVPCNPNALGEARSAGIDTRPLRKWAERVLDTGDAGAMPRRDIEALRAQAREPSRRTTRSASPGAAAVRQVIDDVGASIGGDREAMKAVQGVLASPDEPPLDEIQLKMAIGHVAAAIASKNNALASLRAAMAQADADNELPPQAPAEETPKTPAERLQAARALRRSLPAAAAETPEQRLAEVAELRRSPARPSETRADRMNAAADIKRRLKAEGYL